MGRPKKPEKKMISTRLDPETIEFYAGIAPTRNAGLTFALDVFPVAYKQALTELRGRFTMAELDIIINVMSRGSEMFYGGTGMAGKVLTAKVADLD